MATPYVLLTFDSSAAEQANLPADGELIQRYNHFVAARAGKHVADFYSEEYATIKKAFGWKIDDIKLPTLRGQTFLQFNNLIGAVATLYDTSLAHLLVLPMDAVRKSPVGILIPTTVDTTGLRL